MKKFLFKPVQKIIAKRQEEAGKELAEAKAKNIEAQKNKIQYESSMKNIEQERVKTLQEARKSADAEYNRIVNDAADVAKQIKEDAVTQAENQKVQILKKAEKEIADMVVEATTKVIGNTRGKDVDHSLYNEFLDKAGDNSDSGSI
jgi:F-type H+-transporting ATPase subunit b